MSWRTHPAILALRGIGRRLGVNRLAGAWRQRAGYEDRFQATMLGGVRVGDVVWDVGANVGLYTRRFAERVGSSGRVLAIEPSPANLQRLRCEVEALANVTVMPVALGAAEGRVAFEQGRDELGATSRVVGSATQRRGTQVEVPLRTADGLVANDGAPLPDVVKIDTEGFEWDVLLGMGAILESGRPRLVCVEVHFALLAERGQGGGAPAQIESLLAAARFQPAWVDASHIVATRIA